MLIFFSACNKNSASHSNNDSSTSAPTGQSQMLLYIYAVPSWNGGYLVRGMGPGTYSVYFMGHGGYQDTTLTNIVVNGASTTEVPTLTLHK